ncbi:hypothetical protein FQN54_009888 [Arachnomyces sp. PD_36]|nr:hypothetical protein FQN54_009888 [Arachnomyces sp. PD_36]
MSELSFTKSFLSTLDARPVKLPADHVFDPHTFALRIPFTLPRLPNPPHPPMPKKQRTSAAPGSSKSITISLKSTRNPALQFKVENLPLSSATILELKEAVQDRIHNDGAQVPLDKIKILWKRKPVQGKVADALTDEAGALGGGKEVEFGVMIMGGAQEVVRAPKDEEMVATEAGHGHAMEEGAGASEQKWKNGREVLQGDAFWRDLEGFLAEQVKDEGEAGKLKDLFKSAWTASR